jgi:hypothetical protein
MASEKSTDEGGSRYNKGTIRGDLRYLVASKDVRRHRLISISYISQWPCHRRSSDSKLRQNRTRGLAHSDQRLVHTDRCFLRDAIRSACEGGLAASHSVRRASIGSMLEARRAGR